MFLVAWMTVVRLYRLCLQVCRQFNDVGGNLLSRGFVQIERRHAAIFKRVKALLPRRESERRVHPLFRHCDILSAIETRISMLNMTYKKYIERNMCCFIPGKVLDELERVLNVVEKSGAPPRANEILQELRDISSMAMEYFDEKILPAIKEQQTKTLTKSTTIAASAADSAGIQAPKVTIFVQHALLEYIRKLPKVNRRQRAHMNCLNKVVQKLYARVEKQQATIKAQAAVIQAHTATLQAQEAKLQQHDGAVGAMQARLDAWEAKFAALSNVLDVEMTSRNQPPIPPVLSVDQKPASGHKTIIRPRVSQVQAPNTYIVELERKRKASICADATTIPNKLRLVTMRRDAATRALRDQLTSKLERNVTRNIANDIRKQAASTPDGDRAKKKDYDFARLIPKAMDLIWGRSNMPPAKQRKRRLPAMPDDINNLIDLH